MLKVCYQLTVDTRSHTAEFADTRRKIPLVKAWGDRPEDLATVYRAAAAYFLELAHQAEHAADFLLPEYNDTARLAQFELMTEENPFLHF